MIYSARAEALRPLQPIARGRSAAQGTAFPLISGQAWLHGQHGNAGWIRLSRSNNIRPNRPKTVVVPGSRVSLQNSFSVTESPEQDPKGFAAVAILGAALSLLTTGFVFGTKNNLFHLPIVGMLFDEPQFRHDAFIQSLRFYAAGPFLLLQGADRYVDPATLFAALDALSRLIAFTGFLACATLLGITSRRDRLIFTVLIAFSRILAGSSYAGDGGLFINYFTPAEFANGTSLLALVCAVRARIVAAFALNGLVFFCSDFVAVWNAVPLALLFASQVFGRKIGLVQLLGRGAVGIGIFAVLAAPVVLAVTASPDFGQPTGFDYRTYLDQFWPFHFLFNSIPLNQKLGLLALIMTGSAALMAIGDSARPFLLAFGGYILVYAIGIALPVITDNATLLNLHLLQSGSAIHLLTALATCALATRLMRSTDGRESRLFGPVLILMLCISKLAAALSGVLVVLYLMCGLKGLAAAFAGRRTPPILRYAVLVLPLAVWPYLIWKQHRINESLNGEIAQWTAVGRWARASTAPNALFLIPTSDFRAEAVRPVQTDPGAREYEIFEYVSHRRVWVDFVRGAAVLWSPSYYSIWRQRLPEVLQLRSLSQKMNYAAAHDIDYVVSDCGDAVPSAPVFQLRRLCVYDTKREGPSG
jgi:hypothetical protein